MLRDYLGYNDNVFIKKEDKMTGTLSGYLVYRLQDRLRDYGGHRINYDDMIAALTNSLIELSKDMKNGETIELPNGNTLMMNKLGE